MSTIEMAAPAKTATFAYLEDTPLQVKPYPR